ncbi:MAG: glycosyltransferase [Calditrichaeota bacterium]|nr:MAG: glycosyltransferase [Calditrichota bacterium]
MSGMNAQVLETTPGIPETAGRNGQTRDGRKINILFMIDTFFGVGGTEKQLLELIARLDKRKFSCYVCPFYFSEEMLSRVTQLGAQVWPTPIKRIYGLSGLRQAFGLISKMHRCKIDIVSTFHFAADTYGVLVAKLAGVPCVVSNRRDTGDHHHNKYSLLIKMLNPLVDRYFAVCDAVASHITEDYGVDRNKVRTIHSGIDLSKTPRVGRDKLEALRARHGIARDAFVVGNISHLRPEKGYDVFFEAIRRVKPEIPGLKVLAVGSILPSEKPFLDRIMRFARDKGIEENLILTGYVSNATDYIGLMDIACLTAVRNEGFSNALLEEMMFGKPVIATDVGGNREAIVHKESGIIIPPNDAEALASWILKLYRDPGLRKRLGQAAKKRVHAYFRIEKTVSEFEKQYVELYREANKQMGVRR